MENLHCDISDCDQKPSKLCICRPNLSLCDAHLPSHIQAEGTHEISEVITSIDVRTKDILIKKVEKLKDKINSCWNQYKDSKKFYLEKDSYLVSLNAGIMSRQCDEIIEKSKNLTEVIDYGDGNYADFLLRMNPDQIQTILNTWKINLHNDFLRFLKNLDLFSPKTSPLDFNSEFKYNIGNRLAASYDEIKFFWKENKFYTYDLENSSVLGTLIQINQSIRHDISMCPLPNGETFCFGNFDGTCFIIKSDGAVKKLPCCRRTLYSGSVYYNGYVYVFGGAGNNSEKFSLSRNIWIKIARIPRTSDYTSCAVLANKVLVTGYHMYRVYTYDTHSNSFSEFLDLTGDVHKLVCTSYNRAYIIDFGHSLYESGINNLTSWQVISADSTRNSSYISYRVFNQKGIYFINFYCDLFCFNLKSKSVEHVRNLRDVDK